MKIYQSGRQCGKIWAHEQAVRISQTTTMSYRSALYLAQDAEGDTELLDLSVRSGLTPSQLRNLTKGPNNP